ncbi:GNAT family N-acetyltransferase [Flavobacterium sp. 3HN19-14]|uniref:GNAT family N-acetyltransferase n=1 Tax=Flavobacterium sp. 3HN19-14 TaxID=3448133 RepID=UPI003EDF39CE
MRSWRNSDYVNSRMFETGYITAEMQQKWFGSINNGNNYYFVSEHNGEYTGLMHIKNISDNAGEGGIFLASDKFENTDVVARMVLCFNDFAFDDLKIGRIYSKVKADNKKAISSSKAQGCVVDEEKSTDDIVHFNLNRENYIHKTAKIKLILSKQNG